MMNEQFALIREAAAGATSAYEVEQGLRRLIPEGQESEFQWVVAAFGYVYISQGRPDWREREQGVYGAMMEFANGRFPPLLREIDDEMIEQWADLYERVDLPIVRSRVGDLLWIRRHGERPDVYARGAAEGTLELATSAKAADIDLVDVLERGLEIALEISDRDLLVRIPAQMMAIARAEMEFDEHRPGIPLGMLGPLVDLPAGSRPPELFELLGQVRERYSDDPHIEDSAIDLMAALTDGDGRIRLRREQVGNFLRASETGDGMLRQSFLLKALEASTKHGLVAESLEIRKQLDEMSEDEFDLKRISAEVEVEREEVERFRRAFLDADDWDEFVSRLSLNRAPGGSLEALDKGVAEQIANAPLRSLVRNILLSPVTGQPIFEAADEESFRLLALGESRNVAIQVWSSLLVNILDEFATSHGSPDPDVLAGVFESDLIDPATARTIADALDHYANGRYNEAAHLLLPRIEAVIRNLARDVGLVISTPQVGQKPGGVRSLGELLMDLRRSYPLDGTMDYLYDLLCNPLSANFRNVISHGLVDRVGARVAALLLHVACILRSLRIGPAEQTGDSAGTNDVSVPSE